MSLITLSTRPLTRFDPTSKTHRQYYAQFLIKRNWGNCPVRFYLEPGYGDIVSMIENKLSWYYLSRETKKTLPERSESWLGQK